MKLGLPACHQGLVDRAQLDDWRWSWASFFHPHPGHRATAAGARNPKASVPAGIPGSDGTDAETALAADSQPTLNAGKERSRLAVTEPELKSR